MVFEVKHLSRHSLSCAATAFLLGVLLVAVVAAPAKAAPRPRRRIAPATATAPATARHLQVVSPPAGAVLRAAGAAAPLADRVADVVAQRRTVFEKGPEARPAATARQLAPVRRTDDHLLRRRLAETFGPELARAGRDASSMLDALEAATSFGNWIHLRDLGRPQERAARAMELLVRGILSDAYRPVDRT